MNLSEGEIGCIAELESGHRCLTALIEDRRGAALPCAKRPI